MTLLSVLTNLVEWMTLDTSVDPRVGTRSFDRPTTPALFGQEYDFLTRRRVLHLSGVCKDGHVCPQPHTYQLWECSGVNQLTMVRRWYTYDVQRAQSSQSSDSEEMEEYIFVGGKPSKEIRKRVGDIRFWLEDREKRRTKGEHGETSAFTTTHHENSAPVRATTTPRPKRNTTTPRRILSHIESKLSCIIGLSARC